MEEETEVVGFEGVTRGAVEMENGLVMLDKPSILPRPQ